MSGEFLLDTNILIYYFNGIIDDNRIDTILQTSFNVSIISKIEFLSWQELRDNKNLGEKALAFMSYANIIPLSNNIANKTIEIRQHYKIKTPDAIIGATALTYRLNLVTNNLDDFKHLNIKLLSGTLKGKK